MSSRSVSSFFEAKLSLFLLALLLAVSGRAEDSLGEKISAEVRRLFDERRDSTVRIEAYDRHGKLSGTGFFADPAGTIYTLSYVVANAEEIFVVHGDRRMPAKLLVADARSGIALLKVDYNSPFIPIGNSKELSLASPVVAIGFPVNLAATPSFGIVGGFDRQFLGRYFMTTHIRAIVPVEPGFGGAPLMNLKGEVVGIVVSGIDGGGACYALPVEAAEKIRMDYVRFGEVRHGWVGANVEDQNGPGDVSRVRIAELAEDTPAAQAGLKEGDIVTRIGGVKITTAEDVIDASFFLTAGDRVPIAIERNGREMSIDVRPVKHPVGNSPYYSQGGLTELRALTPGPPPDNLKLE
ncbi:MAG TPA: S1C family serine protease [Terrimicrobiaceae bacterium]|jgi:S1-C subfamily serine protease|nr:S1C family serine protease [Terrimicrobiaceae bacterium]